MRGPGENGKGKTLEEWAEMAEDIFKDVQNQLQASDAQADADEPSTLQQIQGNSFAEEHAVNGAIAPITVPESKTKKLKSWLSSKLHMH